MDFFQQPCHILSQRTHDLQAFGVLCRFSRFLPVNAVPVLRRNHRHIRYGKVFVQPVKSRTGSSAAARDDTGRWFAAQLAGAGKKQTVQ